MSDSKASTKSAEYHRLWSTVTKTCLALTLKTDENSVMIKCKESVRDDLPRESSKLKLERDDGIVHAIGWRIVFTLEKKDYALHVDNNNNTVTAVEVTDNNPLSSATYFVPTKAIVPAQPFVTWTVGSEGSSKGKYIAVDGKGRLSVKASDCPCAQQGYTFAKIKVCPA